MSGKTHLAFSIAMISPLIKDWHSALFGLPIVVLGALMPDIDADYSILQGLKYIIFYLFFGITLLYFYHSYVITIALIIMCILIIFLKFTEHRSASHSLLFMVIFSLCIYMVSHIVVIYFIIGYGSHLFLDMLTHDGIQLFYPYDKEISIVQTRSEIYFFSFSVLFLFLKII